MQPSLVVTQPVLTARRPYPALSLLFWLPNACFVGEAITRVEGNVSFPHDDRPLDGHLIALMIFIIWTAVAIHRSHSAGVIRQHHHFNAEIVYGLLGISRMASEEVVNIVSA